jgi:hypothetical protein
MSRDRSDLPQDEVRVRHVTDAPSAQPTVVNVNTSPAQAAQRIVREEVVAEPTIVNVAQPTPIYNEEIVVQDPSVVTAPAYVSSSVLAPPVVATPAATYVNTARPVAVYSYTTARIVQILWFALGVLESLLALRFAFRLLGANPDTGFAAMLYAVTWPFVIPFAGIFATPASQDAVFETSTLIAMLIYWLAAYGIVQAIKVGARRPPAP